MLYTTATWEKINAHLFKTGNMVISQRSQFMDSPASTLMGIVIVGSTALNLGVLYISGNLTFSSLETPGIMVMATRFYRHTCAINGHLYPHASQKILELDL